MDITHSMSEATEYIVEEAQETGLPFHNRFMAWNELRMHLSKSKNTVVR